MPDIETTFTDRDVRITQATKAGRASLRNSVPTAKDLDEGVPQYALSKSRGLVYQFIKINGIMYHSALEKGEITELDVEV